MASISLFLRGYRILYTLTVYRALETGLIAAALNNAYAVRTCFAAADDGRHTDLVC